jgi:arsenate reductase
VIGSGIAAQRLSPGATGLELLENAAATAAGLFAIIVAAVGAYIGAAYFFTSSLTEAPSPAR